MCIVVWECEKWGGNDIEHWYIGNCICKSFQFFGLLITRGYQKTDAMKSILIKLCLQNVFKIVGFVEQLSQITQANNIKN